MRDFLYDCVASAPSEAADRLAEARALFAETGGARDIPAQLPCVERFAALIASEAFDSAALALLGPDTVFILSRGGGGKALASVVSADGDEVTAEGSTTALALLAAQVSALLADADYDSIAGDQPARARIN